MVVSTEVEAKNQFTESVQLVKLMMVLPDPPEIVGLDILMVCGTHQNESIAGEVIESGAYGKTVAATFTTVSLLQTSVMVTV